MPAIDVRRASKVEGRYVYPSTWELIIGETAYDDVYISPTEAPVKIVHTMKKYFGRLYVATFLTFRQISKPLAV